MRGGGTVEQRAAHVLARTLHALPSPPSPWVLPCCPAVVLLATCPDGSKHYLDGTLRKADVGLNVGQHVGTLFITSGPVPLAGVSDLKFSGAGVGPDTLDIYQSFETGVVLARFFGSGVGQGQGVGVGTWTNTPSV